MHDDVEKGISEQKRLQSKVACKPLERYCHVLNSKDYDKCFGDVQSIHDKMVYMEDLEIELVELRVLFQLLLRIVTSFVAYKWSKSIGYAGFSQATTNFTRRKWVIRISAGEFV